MLPPPTPVIGARNHGFDPVIQTQAPADGGLPRKQFRRSVVPDIVVVRYHGRDGSVEDGEQAQRRADAVRAVPERGGGEEVRCQEGEIVWVSEGREERGCGSEDAGIVSWAAREGGGWRYRGVSSWSV